MSNDPVQGAATPDAIINVPNGKTAGKRKVPKPEPGFITQVAMQIGYIIDTIFGTVAYRDDQKRE